MKRLLIPLGAIPMLLIGFSSCSHDDNTPIEPTGGEKVSISATIANFITHTPNGTTTRVSYDDSGVACFDSGDLILVVNTTSADADTSENRAVYTYDDEDWIALSGELLWERGFTNTFQAYYPATTEFTLPTDQSTPDKLAAADRMEAQVTANAGTTVVLNFQHYYAKVTFNVVLASEFNPDTDVISRFDVVTCDGDYVKPYIDGNSYTAVIPANPYFKAGVDFALVTINGELLEVEIPDEYANPNGSFVAGKHYTFDLKVGKDKVSVEQVSMNDFDSPFGDGWSNEEDLK